MRGMGIPTFRRSKSFSQHLFPNDGEVALNQQVKDLIQRLGEAIHESISESDQISASSAKSESRASTSCSCWKPPSV